VLKMESKTCLHGLLRHPKDETCHEGFKDSRTLKVAMEIVKIRPDIERPRTLVVTAPRVLTPDTPHASSYVQSAKFTMLHRHCKKTRSWCCARMPFSGLIY